MRLTLDGSRRKVYTHILASEDISKLSVTGGDWSGLWAEMTFDPKSVDVTVNSTRRNLSLNGDFDVQLRLTKWDIARLAAIAFQGDAFFQIIRQLSKREADERRKIEALSASMTKSPRAHSNAF